MNIRTITLLFLLFTNGNIFSQNRLFSLIDSNVKVGDSCIVYPVYALCHTDDCIETILLCDSIRSFLLRNNYVQLVIQSNTDCRGKDQFNDTLTLNRANRLRYLILSKSNIDSARIIANGLGERNPRIVDEAIHKQNPFLKIGQVLDGDYIISLKEISHREIAHGLNRRTVLRIMKNITRANMPIKQTQLVSSFSPA